MASWGGERMSCVNVVVVGTLVAALSGCGGRASQFDGASHASTAGSGGSFGGVGSVGVGGLGSASAGNGNGGSVSLVEPPDLTSSGQAGGTVYDAGTVSVVVDSTDAGLTDAGLADAGFGDAGCDVMARDISCIGLRSRNVCAFMSGGRACNVDTDCAWLLIPDCCCTAPRYVLDPSASAGSACIEHVCTRGFVLPG